ncbi:MAG: hypothetical protein J5595_01575, partial [Bacteroidales bacterium]|nr:hypothetical protein [Bacteroidales bacterium]
MKFFYKIIIAAVMVSVAGSAEAQTRNVPVKGWEADSIECANIGNKKFHSAIRPYSADADVSPTYALQTIQGNGRWML